MNESARSPGAGRIHTLAAARSALFDRMRLAGRLEATISSQENALAQFAKFWGGRDLREATPADLEAYAVRLKARVSRETAYVYLNAVRALFRLLAETGALLVDPSAGLLMPKVRRRPVRRILSVEEMRCLVESPDASTPTGLRDRALLELLYSTALRISEARLLRTVDLGEGALAVRQGKGAKDRMVPVGDRALAWVRRYLAQARTELAGSHPDVQELWISVRGRPWSDQMFRLHLRALGRAAGIEHLTCHTIRRSMATHLLAAGAGPAEVSAILGHEDLRSLSRYVAVATREVKETHAATHPREQP